MLNQTNMGNIISSHTGISVLWASFVCVTQAPTARKIELNSSTASTW